MTAHSPFETPDLGAPTADAHAHLAMLEDPAGALERAALAHIAFVVTIVYPSDAGELSSLDAIAAWREEAGRRLADRGADATVPDVAVSVGVHPHEAKDFDEEALALVERLTQEGVAVAVGETGLDFHYDLSPRDAQRRAFRAQLAFARGAGLPVIVHLRDAHDEGFEILSEVGVPEAGCVIHCFGEDAETAERFLRLGCHVSFAGTVTFKKAEMIREAAAVVPLERLLVETDCPFLAPEPYRGRKNEPALVAFCAEAVASARGETPAVVARATLENARSLFGGGGGGA